MQGVVRAEAVLDEPPWAAERAELPLAAEAPPGSVADRPSEPSAGPKLRESAEPGQRVAGRSAPR
jgi:hypothetical protein